MKLLTSSMRTRFKSDIVFLCNGNKLGNVDMFFDRRFWCFFYIYMVINVILRFLRKVENTSCFLS